MALLNHPFSVPSPFHRKPWGSFSSLAQRMESRALDPPRLDRATLPIACPPGGDSVGQTHGIKKFGNTQCLAAGIFGYAKYPIVRSTEEFVFFGTNYQHLSYS